MRKTASFCSCASPARVQRGLGTDRDTLRGGLRQQLVEAEVGVGFNRVDIAALAESQKHVAARDIVRAKRRGREKEGSTLACVGVAGGIRKPAGGHNRAEAAASIPRDSSWNSVLQSPGCNRCRHAHDARRRPHFGASFSKCKTVRATLYKGIRQVRHALLFGVASLHSCEFVIFPACMPSRCPRGLGTARSKCSHGARRRHPAWPSSLSIECWRASALRR